MGKTKDNQNPQKQGTEDSGTSTAITDTSGSGTATDKVETASASTTQSMKVKTQENVEDVKKTAEWKEFITLCKVTGQLPGEFEDLVLEKQKEFEVGFNQWIKAGKPKPSMPELPKEAIASPVDIWIVKHKSKIWYYYDDTMGKKHGVKEILGKIVGYEFEFDQAKVKQLIAERDELTPLSQIRSQYIVFDNRVHPIHEDDLLRDFDQVQADVRQGKI